MGNKITYTLFLILIVIILLVGCTSHYEKVDNQWAFISYDEGVGKRIRKIKVDNETFEIINELYAKDVSRVYYKGRIIKGAESKSFEIIKNDYSKDLNNVYLFNYQIIGANPKNFKILEGFFSRDNKHIYNGTIPLLNIKDIKSFKVTEPSNKIQMISSKEFIKKYPSYSFINTDNYKVIVFSRSSIGNSKDKFFKGIEQIK